MPRYQFPAHVHEPSIVEFFGKLSLQFKVRDDTEWAKIYENDGVRRGDYAVLPLTSPYICGSLMKLPPADDLHVAAVSTKRREIVLELKRKRYENMDFPPGTWAVIADTNLPVSDHFADNFCAYCTGLYAKEAEEGWLQRFYSELGHPGNHVVRRDERLMGQAWPLSEYKWQNPYAKTTRQVWCEVKWLTPCSPWPVRDWRSNGLTEHCNLDTMRTLDGRLVHGMELQFYFQWPSRMAVAIFFSKRLGDFEFALLRGRAARFCESYPVDGKRHVLGEVRQVLLKTSPPSRLSPDRTPDAPRTPYNPLPPVRHKVRIDIEELDNNL